MSTEALNWKHHWWAIPAGLILVLALIAMFGGGEAQQKPPPHSTLDASPDGIRAAYLVLESLHYPVAASRRLGEGKVRWLLFPNAGQTAGDDGDSTSSTSRSPDDVPALRDWVSHGGVLLLADDKPQFAKRLGARVKVEDKPETLRLTENGRNLDVLGGSTQVVPLGQPDNVWPARGQPLANIFRSGDGEIWVLSRPEFLQNAHLRDGDNALALCALADAMTSQGRRIYFDEYFHGLRDRPGVLQLLLQPPTVWFTLEGVLLLILVLWRSMPRFGPIHAQPPPRRRSKEEFLDAMADLLARKKAYSEAYRTVQTSLRRDLEETLGLPAHAPPALIAQRATLIRPGLEARLFRALDAGAGPGRLAELLREIRALDDLRNEFFHERAYSKAF